MIEISLFLVRTFFLRLKTIKNLIGHKKQLTIKDLLLEKIKTQEHQFFLATVSLYSCFQINENLILYF